MPSVERITLHAFPPFFFTFFIPFLLFLNLFLLFLLFLLWLQQELLTVHSQEYLDSLYASSTIAGIVFFLICFVVVIVLNSLFSLELTEVSVCSIIPNFMLRSKVLTPMLYSVSGTILAGKVALDRGRLLCFPPLRHHHSSPPPPSLLLFASFLGYCINLSGGYHHASGTHGGGFCIYSDISISLRHIRINYPFIQNVMIIDLDAHQVTVVLLTLYLSFFLFFLYIFVLQGNGLERDKMAANDPNLFIVDIYNRSIL